MKQKKPTMPDYDKMEVIRAFAQLLDRLIADREPRLIRSSVEDVLVMLGYDDDDVYKLTRGGEA
jgi:uncharacterized protein (UPF0147 family)